MLAAIVWWLRAVGSPPAALWRMGLMACTRSAAYGLLLGACSTPPDGFGPLRFMVLTLILINE